ncbi:MAG: hypothetical protein JW759_07025 [Candidatus Coatesbacteria bacterium]|nr:hypothetical protein [Candidatus Coatesbacteria bacterium]
MTRVWIVILFFALAAAALCRADEWHNYDGLGWRSVRCAALGPDGSIWTEGAGGTDAGSLLRSLYVDGQVQWRHYGRYNSVVTPELVKCLWPDSNGLWIGTYDGLTLFSGYYTTTYTTANSGLVNNCILNVCGDEEGGLWVLTYGGVCNLRDGLWTSFTSESTILPGALNRRPMAYDVNSHLLALTAGSSEGEDKELSLYVYDGREWFSWSSEDSGLVAGDTTALAFDHDGRLWISFGNNGIESFDGVEWRHWTSENSGLPSDNIGDIAISPDGQIYVASTSVCRLVNGRWVILPIPMLTANPWFSQLLFDSHGALWVFSSEGYIRLDLGMTAFYYPTTLGLIDAVEYTKIVCSRFSDRVWVAGGDLCRFENDTWDAWTPDNSAVEGTGIRDIEEAPDGSLWVLGADWLDRFDGQGWTSFSRGIGYFHPDCEAKDLAIGQDYTVWVATIDGLLSFDWESWSKFPLPENPEGFDVWLQALALDASSGTVWAGGIGTLYSFDNGEWRTFPLEPKYVNVSTVTVDHDGVVWGGVWLGSPPTRGAFSFDGQTVEYYHSSDSGILDGKVSQVAVDEENRKWFAIDNEHVPGGGISCFDGVVWANYTCHNSGLVRKWADWTPAFVSVACDDNGDKWFGSRYFGVSRLRNVGTPDPTPSVQILLNQSSYRVGDLMKASLTQSNLARGDWEVNLLIAVMLPDGSLYYFPDWTSMQRIFMFQSLRPGTRTEPESFFEIEIGDWLPKGEYVWFAGLADQTGSIVGGIAGASFRIE